MVHITEEKIDVSEVISSVYDNRAGGIDVFIGTTRNKTSEKSVKYLEFESHVSMALKEMQKIVDAAFVKWPLFEVALVHRIGRVTIGDEAVVIAVSSAHRAAAFEACRYVIDTLKETVPIWKKETFEDGEVWVAAHP